MAEHRDSFLEKSVFLKTRVSLIARLKGGTDEPSWKEFYEMYWRVIYGYVLRFGLEQSVAEDLVQEVFVKVFRQLPAFQYSRAKGRFLSWIKTITRTTVIDFLRRRSARMEGHARVEAQDSAPDVFLERAAEETPDPWQEEWEQSVLALAIERVQSQIGKETFKAFALHVLEDRAPDDVAAVLGISRNAVYVAKSKVLSRLRKEAASIRSSV